MEDGARRPFMLVQLGAQSQVCCSRWFAVAYGLAGVAQPIGVAHDVPDAAAPNTPAHFCYPNTRCRRVPAHQPRRNAIADRDSAATAPARSNAYRGAAARRHGTGYR